MQIDPKRIIDFIKENDIKISVQNYGKERDPRPQIMLCVGGASIPLPSGETKAIIEAIVSLMTSKGIQTTYLKAGQ